MHDILGTVAVIEDLTHGMDYDAFAGDKKTQFAVVRALEIMGEATKNIPLEIRDHYAFVPWRDMARTRDKLSHDYLGVDLEIVWQTIQQDLPDLVLLLDRVLSDSEDDTSPTFHS